MTTQIHIQATGTEPSAGPRQMLRERGMRLRGELEAKVGLATWFRLSPTLRAQAREGLAAFCAHRLARELRAIDHTLYAAAAGAAQTRLLVRALRAQHDLLAAQISELDHAEDPDRFAAAAHGLVALLRARQHVEQEVLLPALDELSGGELADLVADMDVVFAGGVLKTPDVLDVREIPHGRRHPRIFALYSRLAPGQSFTLVNNHDPKPLRREFEATYPGQYSWDYLHTGPGPWQVRIGKPARPQLRDHDNE